LRAILARENLVFLDPARGWPVNCAPVRNQGFVHIGEDETGLWAEAAPFTGRLRQFDTAPAEALFDHAAGLAEPPAGPPDLSYAQFQVALASQSPEGTFLEDVIDSVLDALKNGVGEVPADPATYRMLRGLLARQRFAFADVMALIGQLAPLLAALWPEEDFSEEAVLAVWQAAQEDA
jgi:hypothetical protein